MPADGREIVLRYERLKQKQANHENRWERMAPYVAPSRANIQNRSTIDGQEITRGVYDSSTAGAAEMAAMFIGGNTINPSQQWVQLRMEDEVENEADAIREALEAGRDRLLTKFAASSFYSEALESLIDWIGFGTGCLLIEEAPMSKTNPIDGFRGFHCESVKTGRFVISEGANGLVDTLMREYPVSPRIVEERWGEGALTSKMREAKAAGKIDERFCLIHDIEPRTMGERKAGNLGMPFQSAWVEQETKEIVAESGYPRFPAAIPRHMKTPGEALGRGRGELAYPDAWTLNTAKRMGFEDWALKIRPPIATRHDSVFGTIRFKPAGIMSFNTHGRPIRDVAMPWDTGSHPEISQIKEEELRRSIDALFYVDTLRLLLQGEKPDETATAWVGRLNLLYQLIGMVYARMEREWLREIVEIGWSTMDEAGEFADLADQFEEVPGEIDPDFDNPVARAQKVGDVEAITLAFNDMAPLAQIYPRIYDRFDPEKLSEHVVRVRGVPAKVTRSDKEIELLREAQQKQDEAELAAQQVQETSQAMRNVAPLIKTLQEPQQSQVG